jgi:hypothetical protein
MPAQPPAPSPALNHLSIFTDVLCNQSWHLMWRLLDELLDAKGSGDRARAARIKRISDRATDRWKRRERLARLDAQCAALGMQQLRPGVWYDSLADVMYAQLTAPAGAEWWGI